MSKMKSRSEEIIGKFYVSAFGTIGLILDYNDGTERCSWISSGGIRLSYSAVSVDAIKDSIHAFDKLSCQPREPMSYSSHDEEAT